MSELATIPQKNATGTLVVRSMDDLARLGNMLASSGYFTDAKEAAQAGVKVLAGLEMGIGAFSAMAGIHVIKGKPSVGAGLMAAAVKRHPKYDYRVRRHDAEGCRIEFFEGAESIGVSEFTLDDARAAGLVGNDNWKRNPKNMLFARALSNGVRWYCPDVFDVSTYTPEELGADVDGEGNIISVPVAAPAPSQRAVEAEQTAADEEASPEPELMISAADAKAIGDALKPLKLDRDEARKAVELVIDREIVTFKDLTREEGEALAQMSTDQWADAMDSFRVPA